MRKQEIYFENGKQAWFVHSSQETPATEILHTLGLLPTAAVIVVVGGTIDFSPAIEHSLSLLYTQGLTSAATRAQATIIDGGSHAGIFALIGESVAQQQPFIPLIGVAPSDLAIYPGSPVVERPGETAFLDPNHPYFVLVQGDTWGDETGTLFKVARELAANGPVVTILTNGGAIAVQEALHTVRQGWPLLILEGSGRLADTIAALWRAQPAQIEEAALREIITTGRITLFPIHGSPLELVECILTLLH